MRARDEHGTFISVPDGISRAEWRRRRTANQRAWRLANHDRVLAVAREWERTHRPHYVDRRTPEYRAWEGAKARTTRPTHGNWRYYGGRGIRMCEEWLHSFAAFLAHVGSRPGPGYSLDRIDNDGHYEPGNVRWATRLEQNRNRTFHRLSPTP